MAEDSIEESLEKLLGGSVGARLEEAPTELYSSATAAGSPETGGSPEAPDDAIGSPDGSPEAPESSHEAPVDAADRPAKPGPWYGRTRVVAAALVLFFPLGLVLVWRRSDWSRARRVLVTAAVAVVLAVAAVLPASSRPADRPVSAPPGAVPVPAAPSVTAPTRPSAHPSRHSRQRIPARPVAQGPRTSAATVHRARHDRPAPPGVCGAPRNPYHLNLCGHGRLVTDPPRSVCDYFDCTTLFWTGRGYMVRCNDGTFGLSGGRPGSCAFHRGEGSAVRQG